MVRCDDNPLLVQLDRIEYWCLNVLPNEVYFGTIEQDYSSFIINSLLVVYSIFMDVWFRG